MLLSSLAVVQPLHARTFTVLYDFTGGSDGGEPYAGVILDAAGNIYGTTNEGGDLNCNNPYGCGAVFRLDPAGNETVLHAFAGGTDGSNPFAAVIRDARGDLYGTTVGGGSGLGAVYEMTRKGAEVILHSFAGGPSDGAFPYANLVSDRRGNLYGTTQDGGSAGEGTVFRLDRSGTETVLHSFGGGASDGGFPLDNGLVMDAKGNLYGETDLGGTANKGVVYAISRSGTVTVLHSFTGGATDGCYPYGTPAMDAKGNLYGTTSYCGSADLGIVWRVSKDGSEIVLHNFQGESSDGAVAYAGVIFDSKGDLCGVTEQGGSSGKGTVYRLNRQGALTILHSFTGADGETPFGGIVKDANDVLYGTSPAGGSSGYGTVWKLSP